MPVRDVSRTHAGEGDVDRLLAEQCDEPFYWAPECRLPRSPSHRFLERNDLAGAAERAAEELTRWAPLLRPPADDVAPGPLLSGCWPLHHGELFHSDAELLREGFGGLGGLAVPERRRLGRAE